MASKDEKFNAERQSAIVLRDAGGASFGILHPQCATGEDFEVGQAELERRPDELAPQAHLDAAPTARTGRDLYT